MSKLDDLLDELDAGGDRDVEWSARSGDTVLLSYSDGSQILVRAKVVHEPSDSRSSRHQSVRDGEALPTARLAADWCPLCGRMDGHFSHCSKAQEASDHTSEPERIEERLDAIYSESAAATRAFLAATASPDAKETDHG